MNVTNKNCKAYLINEWIESDVFKYKVEKYKNRDVLYHLIIGDTISINFGDGGVYFVKLHTYNHFIRSKKLERICNIK